MYLSPDVTTQTLQLVRELARKFGVLPTPEETHNMAQVTKSIGTSSRDYSTITSWEADLDNSGIYNSADDAVGECYDDSAFDESVTIDGGGTVGLSSVTLTVASGERHDGTAGTGARIVRSASSDRAIFVDNPSPDPTRCRWLEVDANGNQATPVVELDSASANNDAVTVEQMIVHGSANAGRGLTSVGSVGATSVHNSIIYDHTNNAGAADIWGIKISGASASNRVFNTTVHACGRSGGTGGSYGVWLEDDAADFWQNIVVTDTLDGTSGSVADWQVSSYASATADHNASSDATASGTGSLTNITTADQYVSTMGGSEDLHLKSGADCIDAGTDLGTTPSGVEVDIDGRDRDANGDTWDIGADEFVGAAAALITMSLLGVGV